MANLVSDVIKCYRCDFWRRASGEWGRCSIKLGSDLKVETNAGDGWICREMMRWADKGFDQDQFTAASRERHNEDGRPVGKIWYQNKLRKQT